MKITTGDVGDMMFMWVRLLWAPWRGCLVCEEMDVRWPGSHQALQLEKGEDILHSQSCHMTDVTTATMTDDTL